MVRVAIDGSEAGGAANGLTLTAGGSTIEGLSINRFPGSAIVVDGRGGNVIKGDDLGTDTTGLNKRGNAQYGVILVDTTNNLVGGLDPGDTNLVGDNNAGGITLVNPATTGNVVEGNFVGLDATGTGAIGNNGVGIFVANGASRNTIGGSVAAARNVLADNGEGIGLSNVGTSKNLVIGNYIGTDSSGTTAIQNATGVILSDGAADNTIGGTSPGDRNLISGNLVGILIKEIGSAANQVGGNSTRNNRVEGNYIGTDASGTASVGNVQFGIIMINISDTIIGGPEPGAGNVISGTVGVGLQIIGPMALGNRVLGNLIGTDATGLATPGSLGSQGAGVPGPLGNLGGGVIVNNAPFNAIGGPGVGEGNVISGNGVAGLQFFGPGATGNVALGNRIGLDATGTNPIGNSPDGVLINNAPGNTIGGNAISANAGNGIQVVGPGSQGNVISGNSIGTDATGSRQTDPGGTFPLGNTLQGVYINNAPRNTVGGSAASARNVISGNLGNGVLIFNSLASGNVVAGNAIGTDATGSVALGNGAAGVSIEGAGRNLVGGIPATAGNQISANAIGVRVTGSNSSNNAILGDTIGTNRAGTAAMGNQFGVSIEGSSGNLIQADQISGNVVAGVQIIGFGATGNALFASDIGANRSETAPLGNGIGVFLDGVSGNRIGGSAPGRGNVISGNLTAGVDVFGRFAGGNLIQGNLIGTDGTGRRAITTSGQTVGVLLSDAPGLDLKGNSAPGNEIGGFVPGSRNVISGNQVGIEISGKDSRGNVVVGNAVGPTRAGTAGAGNGIGVYLNQAPANRIGGAVGNVISGNAGVGVYLLGGDTTGNLVQGNLIGLTPDGTRPLPNQNGIYVENAPGNTIGGAAPALRNVISANTVVGVYLLGPQSIHNLVEFNRIGTKAVGGGTLGNKQYGVLLYNAPTNTIVRSGVGTNVIVGSGIANFREFTGPSVVANPSSGSSTRATAASQATGGEKRSSQGTRPRRR